MICQLQEKKYILVHFDKLFFRCSHRRRVSLNRNQRDRGQIERSRRTDKLISHKTIGTGVDCCDRIGRGDAAGLVDLLIRTRVQNRVVEGSERVSRADDRVRRRLIVRTFGTASAEDSRHGGRRDAAEYTVWFFCFRVYIYIWYIIYYFFLLSHPHTTHPLPLPPLAKCKVYYYYYYFFFRFPFAVGVDDRRGKSSRPCHRNVAGLFNRQQLQRQPSCGTGNVAVCFLSPVTFYRQYNGILVFRTLIRSGSTDFADRALPVFGSSFAAFATMYAWIRHVP